MKNKIYKMNINRNLFFKDLDVDNEFNSKGFVVHGNISNETIKLLIDAFNLLEIPDSYGFGYNVGLNTELFEKRKAMQDKITEIISSEILPLLNNKKVFTATFMNKVANSKIFLPAHQDWTYTDEDQYDSVMCWIPLVDVTMQNGAMCFVPFSHQLFDYTRSFPFPMAQTPVDKNCNELLGYMEIVNMKAGEMVFINHKTVHASFPNSNYKDRLAVGLSIAPQNEDLFVYCLNPITQGKTKLKYLVDEYFLVNYRHPMIENKFKNSVPYDFKYPIIEETAQVLPNISWKECIDFFEEKGLSYNTSIVNQGKN